jgi:hypothetical protein
MTDSDDHDQPRLLFEKEKWADEIRFRQQEIDLKFRETNIKATEQENAADQLAFSQGEARRNRWTNPLVVAVFAAAVAAGGNAVVALLNGAAQRETEQVRDDQALILESIKANSDPDKAAANLHFLVETALIANPSRRSEIETYLKNRKQGEGPALPSTNRTSALDAALELAPTHIVKATKLRFLTLECDSVPPDKIEQMRELLNQAHDESQFSDVLGKFSGSVDLPYDAAITRLSFDKPQEIELEIFMPVSSDEDVRTDRITKVLSESFGQCHRKPNSGG